MKINIAYIIQNEETLWKSIRWTATNSTPTCKCGCSELYKTTDGRFKCKSCGYTFSETANTILQNTKLPKWKWLFAIYTLSAQRSISVRELASMISVSKSSSHLMLQKIRSYMELDSVDMSGVVCLDEAHIGGWSGMHLKKKIEYMVEHDYMLSGEKYRKEAILAASSEKKQHILCGVNEAGKAKVTHIKGQITKDIVKQVVKQNGITHIISDESLLYRGIKGVTTEQSNHSKHIYMTKGGHTSNPCENRFSWVKRIVGAYHTHTADRYLQLYLNQIIFKMNNKDLSVTDRFMKLGGLCCTKSVTKKDILNYDYTDGLYYEDKVEVDWDGYIEMCGGMVQQVEVGRKIYKR